MNFWTPDNFRQITAGRWLHKPNNDQTPREPFGVSTDTRTLQPGQLFIAIKGNNYDAHDYLNHAIDSGASLLIIENKAALENTNLTNTPILLVNSTLNALAQLATAYRRSFNAKVIAVTGSVGKTTTKQMIHAVLATQYHGTANPKSYNNNIGVPLTILNVNPSDRYVITEIGTNAPGEIAQLAKIAQPDIAVITSVGPAHMQGLGDINDIAREKAAIISHLTDNGIAIVNGDVDELKPHLKLAPSLITFGKSESCDLRVTNITQQHHAITFNLNKRYDFTLPLLGKHNAINALAAIAVGRQMNLDDNEIANGLTHTTQPEMRLDAKIIGKSNNQITIINDAYNANPMSMAAAIDVLQTFPTKGRRIAILGDMLELGSYSKQLHTDLVKLVDNSNIDIAIFIGPASTQAALALRQHSNNPSRVHTIPNWSNDTPANVSKLINPDDTILIKASLSMALFRLIPEIEHRFSVKQKNKPNKTKQH